MTAFVPTPEIVDLVKFEEGRLEIQADDKRELIARIRSMEDVRWVHEWQPIGLLPFAFAGHCARRGHIDLLEAILERTPGCFFDRPSHGAPSDDPRHRGSLFRAAILGDDPVPTVEVLLRHGADPNMLWFQHDSDVWTETPLFVAALEDPEVTRLLLEAGADPLVSTNIGTPIVACQRHGGRRGVATTLGLLRRAAVARVGGRPWPPLRFKKARRRKWNGPLSGFVSRAIHADLAYAVIVSEAEPEDLAECLCRHADGARVTAAMGEEAVVGGSVVFALRLAGSRWSWVPWHEGAKLVSTEPVEQLAREVSTSLAEPVTVFAGGEVTEWHGGKSTVVLAPTVTEDEVLDDASPSWRQRVFGAHDALAEEWGLRVPPTLTESDGVRWTIELEGVTRADVSDAYAVVLEELASIPSERRESGVSAVAGPGGIAGASRRRTPGAPAATWWRRRWATGSSPRTWSCLSSCTSPSVAVSSCMRSNCEGREDSPHEPLVPRGSLRGRVGAS